MATAKNSSDEYEVSLTPAGRWALAVDLLERAARLIGVPTTAEELAAYIEARQRYDAVESSFKDSHPLVEGVSLEEAERNYREQFSDYCRGV